MNLHESIYELNGYVKAIGDKGKQLEEFNEFIKTRVNVHLYPSLPDEAQWLRICSDLSNIVNYLEKLNK